LCIRISPDAAGYYRRARRPRARARRGVRRIELVLDLEQRPLHVVLPVALVHECARGDQAEHSAQCTSASTKRAAISCVLEPCWPMCVIAATMRRRPRPCFWPRARTRPRTRCRRGRARGCAHAARPPSTRRRRSCRRGRRACRGRASTPQATRPRTRPCRRQRSSARPPSYGRRGSCPRTRRRWPRCTCRAPIASPARYSPS